MFLISDNFRLKFSENPFNFKSGCFANISETTCGMLFSKTFCPITFENKAANADVYQQSLKNFFA